MFLREMCLFCAKAINTFRAARLTKEVGLREKMWSRISVDTETKTDRSWKVGLRFNSGLPQLTHRAHHRSGRPSHHRQRLANSAAAPAGSAAP
jgi:hypothetical protein